jgi:hypothetical protein
MARKDGVPKDRVLNCLCKEELASYLGKRCAKRQKNRVHDPTPKNHASGCDIPEAMAAQFSGSWIWFGGDVAVPSVVESDNPPWRHVAIHPLHRIAGGFGRSLRLGLG